MRWRPFFYINAWWALQNAKGRAAAAGSLAVGWPTARRCPRRRLRASIAGQPAAGLLRARVDGRQAVEEARRRTSLCLPYFVHPSGWVGQQDPHARDTVGECVPREAAVSVLVVSTDP